MIIELWYCPRCDHWTYNWRVCKLCKMPAVFQKFECVPIDIPPLQQKMMDATEAKHKESQ